MAEPLPTRGRWLAALALAAALAPATPAQSPNQGELTAVQPLEIDGNTQEVLARGDARLALGGYVLTADEIRFNQQSGTATATGNVVLTGSGVRLVGQRASFDTRTRRVEVTGFRVGSPPWLAQGSSASGSLEDLVVEDATLTPGEPDGLLPTLRARSIRVIGRDEVELTAPSVGLGGLRLLPLPSVRRPAADSGVRVSVEGGYSEALGVFVSPEVLVPLRPGLAFNGGVELYSERGVLLAPGFDYASTAYTGALRAQYINDRGDLGTDILGRAIDEDRWLLQWTHRHDFGDGLDLAIAAAYWSDSELTRDFRPADFRLREQPSSHAELTWARGPWVVSTLVRSISDDFQGTAERLPEVRADLLPVQLADSGILVHGFASAGWLRRDTITGPTFSTPRLDGYAGVQMPLRLGSWGTFTPLAGTRATFWGDSPDGGGFRWLGELGFDLQAATHATWDYANPVWRIDGLRHVLAPRIEYRWIPQADGGDMPFPLDVLPFSTYERPLGLADRRAAEDFGREHVVRTALSNILQTRDPEFGVRELARFDVGVDWRLSNMPGERRTSDVFSDLVAHPASWLEVGVRQRVRLNGGRWTELNPRIVLRDGRFWTLELAQHFLEDRFEQYGAALNYRVNEVWRLGARVRYNARDGRFDEQVYSVFHNIRNIWELEYRLAFVEGSARESSVSFTVGVELLRF